MNEKDKFDAEQFNQVQQPEQPSPSEVAGDPKAVFDRRPGGPRQGEKGPVGIQRATIRYRGAYEFDQQVSPGDVLIGGDRRSLDDSVIITHCDSDRQYKLTIQEAIDRNLKQGKHIWKGPQRVTVYQCPNCQSPLRQTASSDAWQCTNCGNLYTDTYVRARNNLTGARPESVVCDDVAPTTKVHILHQGRVYCNFTTARPVDWPKGHEWIPLDVQNQKETCNCIGCIRVWRPELVK